MCINETFTRLDPALLDFGLFTCNSISEYQKDVKKIDNPD